VSAHGSSDIVWALLDEGSAIDTRNSSNILPFMSHPVVRWTCWSRPQAPNQNDRLVLVIVQIRDDRDTTRLFAVPTKPIPVICDHEHTVTTISLYVSKQRITGLFAGSSYTNTCNIYVSYEITPHY